MKTIVVGAGAAGLTATHELKKRDIEVLTLEKNNAPGGRIACLHEGGYIIDTGAQFLSSVHPETIDLCKEIGLGSDITKKRIDTTMWSKGNLYDVALNWKPQTLFNTMRYFFGGYSMSGLAGLSHLMFYALKRWKDIGPGIFREPHLMDLEGESLPEFAARKANSEVLEKMLQPASSALYLVEPENMSAATGFGCYIFTMKILLFGGLITLRMGLGSIAERLYEMHKGNIRLSTPVRKVVIENGRAKGVETDGGFLEADAVICTTTASEALRLMPDLYKPLSSTLEKASYDYGCHIALCLENKPFKEGKFGIYLPRISGSFLSAIGSGRFMSNDMAPTGDLIHCLSYGNKARKLAVHTDEEIVNATVHEVQKYLPVKSKNIHYSKVFRFDEAVSCPLPGTHADLMAASKESSRYVRGLYLAGDSYNLGSVETAVITGKDAAEMVVREQFGTRDREFAASSPGKS